VKHERQAGVKPGPARGQLRKEGNEMQEIDYKDQIVRDEELPIDRAALLTAVSMAVDRLNKGEIKRIVIYRREGKTKIDQIFY